ncbi:hypothetical protein JAAARDRAFT_323667 [Jaapia argillacea MUCL 33604]|uniref:Uncharacterized protein n=1 Tax=Jaapia argillacea MUCL 33604 TaxID=933084 RepID=A0A067PP43_9AGAM|nr:hypothetical protein JAAARDRAFT_323667 [Jaapia argillacea MUCL 33604]
MPDVTHLRLLNGGSFDDLFDHLARNTAGRKAAHWVRLWPNLSTVTFLDCHHGQYTSLVNFLRKRRKINRPIRNIRIDSEFGNGMGKRSTNALRKLVEVEEIELKEERRMASTTQKIKPDCWYE